jgi:hypothetical protein
MAACPTQHFSNLDAASWQCLQAEVRRQTQIEIGDSGEASQAGFTMAWSYDAEGQTLRITCQEKPFLVPCAVVHQTVSDLVAGCRRE